MLSLLAIQSAVRPREQSFPRFHMYEPEELADHELARNRCDWIMEDDGDKHLLENTLWAKLQEAEQLAARIKQSAQGSEEQRELILRWAVVGDEVTKLMIQAEEQLSPAQLARLKAKINGFEAGALDRWAVYRENFWRLPKFGAPGPGDEPPPTVPLRDIF